MKSILKNYSFNTTTKAITATDVTTVRLDRLALITDTTTNKILYNFADSTVSTATVAGNVITLSALQGGESNTDKLRIDYDVDTTDAAYNDDIGITKLGDGTNSANILKSDGTTAGQNAALTAGTFLQQTYTITSATPTASIDVGNYQWVTVQVTAVGVGSTITWQTCGDNATFLGFVLDNTTLTTPGGSLNTTGVGSFDGPLRGRYFRINPVAWTSGTYTVVVTFNALPRTKQNIAAIQNSTWSIGSSSATNAAVPANAFYIGASNGTNLTGLTTATGAPAGTLATAPRPATSGGVTVAKIASTATTNATSVKAAAGQVYGWSLFNTSAAIRYLKFYNLAVAPTVGSSVPVFIVPLAAGGASNIMLGNLGTPFATGIAYSISTGVADTDATATAVNDVVGSFFYA